MVQALAYRRVLLKLSGEALIGDQGYGIDATMLQYIANEIHDVQQLGGELALVIGGGNIMRGTDASSYGIERVTAGRRAPCAPGGDGRWRAAAT